MFKLSLLAPKYWLVWLMLSLIWLLSKLPFSFQIILGNGLGKLLRFYPSKFRQTAIINIKLCFPDLNAKQRELLLRKNFISVGIGLFETALAWWASKQKLNGLAKFYGLGYLHQALKKGKGGLICAPHFTSLQLAARLLALKLPIALLYLPSTNPVIEWVNRRAYNKHYQHSIRRGEMRLLVNCLRQNMLICYTPDIDPGKRKPFFSDFFGIQAACVSTPARLAKLCGSAILPGKFFRTSNNRHYHLECLSPVHLPTENLAKSIALINKILEQIITTHPDQYLWLYKRFKTRPANQKDFYHSES